MQQNEQVGQVTSLDAFCGSGLYSGVYSNGASNEAFLLVVIDNRETTCTAGSVHSVSQFKYALNVDGTFSYKTRTGRGSTDIEWGSWVDLGAADTTDIQDGAITAQKLSADLLEQINKSANGAYWTSGPNAVTLNINKNDGTVGWQTLSTVTTENAGVMSPEDKKKLDTTIQLEFVRVIGRIINPTSGAFTSVEGAGYLGVIPVKSGEKYLYSGRATQYNAGVAAYDENRAYLYPIICNVDNAVIKKDVCVDEPFTIPEGVAYIAVGTRYQESNPVSIKRVYSPKELADRKVPQLVSYDIIDGYVVNTANGNVSALSGSAVGSFIKVNEGEEFLITAKWGSQTGIAGYDKDKNYTTRLADATLSTFYSAAEVSDYLIRIPQGVEYIRGCTTDAVNYPLKVVKLVSIEDLTEKIPLCQNQFSYAWFGDSISQFGIPENVERKLGSSILDCSFAGAPLTYSTEQYQGTGFMTIASCIKSGDYAPIENALQLQSDAGVDISTKLINLQHIKDANWNAVSHFVVMAGTNDLSFSGATIENIKAGLRQAFQDVISAYPHITIYFVSPPYRGNINSAAGNGLNLLEINEAIEEVCKEFNFPFLDFFHNCGVNQYNKAYYLDAQELHPNANGLALWSSKLANWLKSL